jgi:hypothetical protein
VLSIYIKASILGLDLHLAVAFILHTTQCWVAGARMLVFVGLHARNRPNK